MCSKSTKAGQYAGLQGALVDKWRLVLDASLRVHGGDEFGTVPVHQMCARATHERLGQVGHRGHGGDEVDSVQALDADRA
jgi:hypothetical protein